MMTPQRLAAIRDTANSQPGYHWSDKMVIDLLDHIEEISAEPEDIQIYCAKCGASRDCHMPGGSRYGCDFVYEDLTEQGRRLASEREDLIAAGADPQELVIPLAPMKDLREEIASLIANPEFKVPRVVTVERLQRALDETGGSSTSAADLDIEDRFRR